MNLNKRYGKCFSLQELGESAKHKQNVWMNNLEKCANRTEHTLQYLHTEHDNWENKFNAGNHYSLQIHTLN